jgi:fructokinase
VILVCGEALVDLFVGAPSPDAGGGLSATAVAGGSPFNVAIGLARLGAPAGFFGGLSGDPLGAFLAARLRADGVDTGFAKRSAKPTPLVVVSPDAAGHPSYTFHANDCADRDVEEADLPSALGPEVEALAIGSWPMVVDPVGGALRALAEREGGRRVVSLDPNLRPSMVGDLSRWRERFGGFVRDAAIIKVSEEDIGIAYGPDADAERLARGWLDGGASLVVLTRGPDGATAFHAEGVFHEPGRRVAVADTVGAGDTFHAALLARLRQRGLLRREALTALDPAALRDALRYAVAASGVTCTRRGADLPSAADVDAALSGAAAPA